MRKLVDYGLSTQVMELVVDFISGLWVHLNWGDVMIDALRRVNRGVSQSFLEGMWNVSVYSDNIQIEIAKAVPGIVAEG